MIRSYRENYKNWKDLVNTCVPVGVIYKTDTQESYRVFINETRLGYAFSYFNDDTHGWFDTASFPTTKDWNELVNSFKTNNASES